MDLSLISAMLPMVSSRLVPCVIVYLFANSHNVIYKYQKYSFSNIFIYYEA